MVYAKFGSQLPTIISQISEHPVDSYNECIKHLKAIAELMAIFEPFVIALDEVEAGFFFSELDVPALLGHWEPIPSQIARFRLAHPNLDTDVGCVMFSIGIRVTLYVQALPTPTHYDLKTMGYTFMYNVNLRSTFALVSQWLNSSREYPRHQILTLVFAVVCARRITQFYSLIGTEHPFELDFDIVPLAEQKLYALGGGPARALHVSQHAFKDEGAGHFDIDKISNQEMMSFFDNNDLHNMFNLDFSSWDTIFGGMGSGQGVQQSQHGHFGENTDFRP